MMVAGTMMAREDVAPIGNSPEIGGWLKVVRLHLALDDRGIVIKDCGFSPSPSSRQIPDVEKADFTIAIAPRYGSQLVKASNVGEMLRGQTRRSRQRGQRRRSFQSDLSGAVVLYGKDYLLDEISLEEQKETEYNQIASDIVLDFLAPRRADSAVLSDLTDWRRVWPLELLDNDPRLAAKETLARWQTDEAYRVSLREECEAIGADTASILDKAFAAASPPQNPEIDAVDAPPQPPTGPPSQPSIEQLEDIDDDRLAVEIARREQAGPAFDSALAAARTPRDTFAKTAQPPMELPPVAPRLWADKPKGMTATAFVAEYYAPWIAAGVLSHKAIEACDPDLALAYRNRAHRHPEEAVALVRAPRTPLIADPHEAVKRYRSKGREATARHRARKRDNLTRSPE